LLACLLKLSRRFDDCASGDVGIGWRRDGGEFEKVWPVCIVKGKTVKNPNNIQNFQFRKKNRNETIEIDQRNAQRVLEQFLLVFGEIQAQAALWDDAILLLALLVVWAYESLHGDEEANSQAGVAKEDDGCEVRLWKEDEKLLDETQIHDCGLSGWHWNRWEDCATNGVIVGVDGRIAAIHGHDDRGRLSQCCLENWSSGGCWKASAVRGVANTFEKMGQKKPQRIKKKKKKKKKKTKLAFSLTNGVFDARNSLRTIHATCERLGQRLEIECFGNVLETKFEFEEKRIEISKLFCQSASRQNLETNRWIRHRRKEQTLSHNFRSNVGECEQQRRFSFATSFVGGKKEETVDES
jgi:hypothetical protein